MSHDWMKRESGLKAIKMTSGVERLSIRGSCILLAEELK